MMIDFSKIVGLVPDGGRLVLTFTTRTDSKNGDEGTKELSVVFAQQFKGKENDNDFSPIIVTGGVAELSESFESTIADIARDQKKLAELKTTTTGRVDQKKRHLTDAIQKHTKAAEPKREGDQTQERKPEAKDEKPKPVMADLFSMSPVPPTSTAATSAPEPESLEPDAAEGVSHG